MTDKITRDAFLYMEPGSDVSMSKQKAWAQCSTCFMHDGDEICHIHGKEVLVTGEMSCGLYVYGEPSEEMGKTAMPLVTPDESGLVLREVRCENCYYVTTKGKKTWCRLFALINRGFPIWFNLEPEISIYGCCNAHTVKS